ncbi:MAG TPA: ATP-binding protein [Candidatus Obscuribacterales bacterium]
MALRISLFHKGLILVSVPLLFELAFVGILADLYNRAEAEASRADNARKISDVVNNLVRDLYDLMTTVKAHDFVKDEAVRARREVLVSQCKGEFRELKSLVANDPSHLALVAEVESNALEANRRLDDMKLAYERGDLQEVDRIRRGMNEYLRKIISHELISMAREQKQIGEKGLELKAEYQAQIRQSLSAAVGLSIVLTIFLAVVVTKGLTRRVAIVTENSMRLARNQPLLPLLGGSDEVGQMDHVFHAMANALSEAAQRERALIENARDVICSIDNGGKFTALSAAASRVLGYDPDELLGKHFIDLVHPLDVSHVLSSLDEVVAGGDSQAFEARMIRKDQTPVDILWSARWSETEKTYFVVLHDVTERREAERMKQEVIAMVTHDLRSPLAAVQHIHEMLADGVGGELPAKAAQMIGRARHAEARMMALINDLLDIERIKAGMLELHKCVVPIANLFSTCTETLSALAEEKQIRFQVVDTVLDVDADPDRIVQVLVNLASNAIKFSEAGTTVTLSALEQDGMVEVRVKDEGRGIPQSMQSGIFDRFRQIEAADASEKGGSGLGLSICKAIVELHGGAIWVESEEGKGSTFAFTLPLAPLG